MHGVNDILGIVRGFSGDAHESPTFAFEMELPHRVILGPSRKIVHAAIDLNRYTFFANSEIDSVALDLVLAHDMHAMLPQTA